MFEVSMVSDLNVVKITIRKKREEINPKLRFVKIKSVNIHTSVILIKK